MNCQRSRYETRSTIVGEPERDSVLLLLPTEQNKLTLAWRGPYKVVGTVGEVDYKIELTTQSEKVSYQHAKAIYSL